MENLGYSQQPSTAGLSKKWLPLAMSLSVHAALLWHYTVPNTPTLAPLGHWVEMVPGAKPAMEARSRPSRSVPSPVNTVDENEKPTPATTSPSAAVGNSETSTGITGPLGDRNGVQASLRDRYLYELEAFINQHKTYPARARHLNQSGLVEVAFHIHGDGSISDPHVVRPCIHDLLNRSAVELVSSVGNFRPIPAELGVSVLHVTVPIQYELN